MFFKVLSVTLIYTCQFYFYVQPYRFNIDSSLLFYILCDTLQVNQFLLVKIFHLVVFSQIILTHLLYARLMSSKQLLNMKHIFHEVKKHYLKNVLWQSQIVGRILIRVSTLYFVYLQDISKHINSYSLLNYKFWIQKHLAKHYLHHSFARVNLFLMDQKKLIQYQQTIEKQYINEVIHLTNFPKEIASLTLDFVNPFRHVKNYNNMYTAQDLPQELKSHLNIRFQAHIRTMSGRLACTML